LSGRGGHLDDDTAVAAGREVYGYPKKLASLTLDESGFSVSRSGRPPSATGEGRGEPIELLRGEWEVGSDERRALACIEDFLKARRFENCEMRSFIIGGWGRDIYTPDLPESNANALTEIRRKPDVSAAAAAMTT
jgi:hypothetical protein